MTPGLTESFGLTFMYFIVALAISIAVFLVLRQLVLWYWRINEMADNIAYIANHYRALDKEAGRRVVQTTQSNQGAGSPFSSMGKGSPQQ